MSNMQLFLLLCGFWFNYDIAHSPGWTSPSSSWWRWISCWRSRRSNRGKSGVIFHLTFACLSLFCSFSVCGHLFVSSCSWYFYRRFLVITKYLGFESEVKGSVGASGPPWHGQEGCPHHGTHLAAHRSPGSLLGQLLFFPKKWLG
jgi:hypothetical protein